MVTRAVKDETYQRRPYGMTRDSGEGMNNTTTPTSLQYTYARYSVSIGKTCPM